MKTANLLSLSAFVVLAGMVASVGCAAPPQALEEEDAEEKSATTKGDDDDDDSTETTKSSTNPSNNTPTESVDTTDDPAPTTGDAASCNTCLGSNTQAKSYATCFATCDDDACDDACWESSGCAENESACESSLDKCETQCFGEDPGTEDPGTEDPGTGDGDECLSCLGTSPASEYIQCSDQCQDAECDDQCWEESCGGNERACESKLDQCEAACFQ